jgi:hypothetical protein
MGVSNALIYQLAVASRWPQGVFSSDHIPVVVGSWVFRRVVVVVVFATLDKRKPS